MTSGVAASDVVRSMKREGFVDDEIYDVLTGIGLPGEQVQLLLDRVSAEFEEAGLEPRTSRLGAEVREVFKEVLGEAQNTIIYRVDEFSHELQIVKSELEKLRMNITELQSWLEFKNLAMPHMPRAGKAKSGKFKN